MKEMSFRKKGRILILLSILSLILNPLVGLRDTKATNPGPFFSITVLVPNTTSERMDIASLFVEELPKIGIEVESYQIAGWADISSRTWSYPGPYPIPTYSEGGYDVLFLTWTNGLEFNPEGLYDSPSLTPAGDNFYQYYNPVMDSAVENHSNSVLISDRIEAANVIQNIVYEDLPSIAVAYPELVYPYNESLTGWDSLLWSTIYQPIIGWSQAEKTEFHYAVPSAFFEFHPYSCILDSDHLWLNQIYAGLARRNASYDNNYSTMIAQVYTSSDGLTFNVEIKADAVWADNTPITTDDVIYSYNLSRYLGYIYNNNWDADSITKINDKEFTIKFLQQQVFQEYGLSINLLPKHIWENIPVEDHVETALNWSKEHPEKMFGAGPYMLKEYDNVSRIIHLEKNPYFADWFGIESTFDDIYFEHKSTTASALSALAAGTIDMVDGHFYIALDDLDIAGIQYDKVASGSVHELAINNKHPYIGTGDLCPIAGAESAKHIRKAMSYIFDRAKICSEIFYNRASPGVTFWAPNALDYNASLNALDYNLDWARYHMTQAGCVCQYNSTPPYAPSPEPTIGFELPSMLVLGFIGLVGIVIIIKRRR